MHKASGGSQWEKNKGVLGTFGTNNDNKIHKAIEESNEYYGTQLFKELKEQNKIDVIIRNFNPTVNKHEREASDDEDSWDSDDYALLNAEAADTSNAEKEYIAQLK